MGNDTLVCYQEQLILDASIENGIYLWNTGAREPNIIVDQSGLYIVEVSNGSCSVIDSIWIDVGEKLVDLGADMTICHNQKLVLDVHQDGGTYLWNDGSTETSLEITETGVYWVEVSQGRCSWRDTIVVNKLEAIQLDLGDEVQELCLGEVLTLDASQASGVYTWNTGSNDSKLIVTQSGYYEVSIENECEIYTQGVEIIFNGDCCQLDIPNAFSPNGDGKNELFEIIAQAEIKSFKLEIYNRSGHLIFETNNISQYWDGNINSKEAPNDVYFWQIKMQCKQGEKDLFKSFKGMITLFR